MLSGNFFLEGFIASFGLNHNATRKGIMLFVQKYTPSYLLATVQSPLEGFYVELDLCRIKWVVSCSCNLYKNTNHSYLDALNRSLSLYHSNHVKNVLLG